MKTLIIQICSVLEVGIISCNKQQSSSNVDQIATSNLSSSYAVQYYPVTDLRAKLHYPFVFDFAVSRSDQPVDSLAIDTRLQFGLVHDSVPQVLQTIQFAYYTYRLQPISSFDHTRRYFLVSENDGISTTFCCLFTGDSAPPTLLDSIILGNHGGSLQLQSLNGGQLLFCRYETDGTGYTADHLDIQGIFDSRFHKLYAGYEDYQSTEDSITTISTTWINIRDVNSDNFDDLVATETVESFNTLKDPTGFVKVWTDRVTKRIKPPATVSTTTHVFLWDPKCLVFVSE